MTLSRTIRYAPRTSYRATTWAGREAEALRRDLRAARRRDRTGLVVRVTLASLLIVGTAGAAAYMIVVR